MKRSCESLKISGFLLLANLASILSLCNLVIGTVQSNVSLDKVPIYGGDFALGKLADTINQDHRNMSIVEAWLKHARKHWNFNSEIYAC